MGLVDKKQAITVKKSQHKQKIASDGKEKSNETRIRAQRAFDRKETT